MAVSHRNGSVLTCTSGRNKGHKEHRKVCHSNRDRQDTSFGRANCSN